MISEGLEERSLVLGAVSVAMGSGRLVRSVPKSRVAGDLFSLVVLFL